MGSLGSLPIEVPRDRNFTFEPQVVARGQTRFEGFDDKILSLYARGMTTRQIKQHLEEIYQLEVSPSLISTVADAVIDEVRAWQSRPLEAIGLWISQSEGAKFWLGVITELKNRGIGDVFIACMDGLKGLPEAIEAVLPRRQVRQCIIHQVRASLSYVSWKERKAVAADLGLIYTAGNPQGYLRNECDRVGQQRIAASDKEWGLIAQ